jgi:hypothetical protein
MEEEIKPGDSCTVNHDIEIEGQLVFRDREYVLVEAVEPDAARPESRYVVYSHSTGQRFKLARGDLTPGLSGAWEAPPAGTGNVIAPPAAAPGEVHPPGYAPGEIQPPAWSAPETGKAGRSNALTIAIVVGIAVALAVGLTLFFVFRNGSEVTVTTTEDWKTFEGGGVSIALPDNYEGGATEEINELMDSMKSLGPEYEQMAEIIQQNPELFVLWAFDPEIGASEFATNVNVIAEVIPEGMDLESYLNAATSMMPEDSTIIDSETVQLENYEAGRIDVETDVMGQTARQIAYVIIEKGKAYVVSYSTDKQDFGDREREFEESIETFRVL